VRYLGICDGNMQEGSFRCDANVSVRPRGEQALGTRTEIKNLNSFRFVERAIDFEVARQIELLEGGARVMQETRLYDPDQAETRSMRSKEEANDYRYFPDPDLQPLIVEQAMLDEARAALPELPDAKRERFIADYALSAYDAGVLVAERPVADFFERSAGAAAALSLPSASIGKVAANWVMGDLAACLNRDGIDISESPVSPDALAAMLRRLHDGTISGKLAKEVFEAMWRGEGDADHIIDQQGLRQITDTGELEAIIDQVVADSPGQVAQFRAGREKLLGYFVGQVMKATRGKGNPQQVNELLRRKLRP
jgi:aspartyl-tRNA(Asn)/glutamyl-tRNA(Gln) amidotransferase subunit B